MLHDEAVAAVVQHFFMFYGNVVVLYGSRAIAGFFVACVENRPDSRRGRDDCAVMP